MLVFWNGVRSAGAAEWCDEGIVLDWEIGGQTMDTEKEEFN